MKRRLRKEDRDRLDKDRCEGKNRVRMQAMFLAQLVSIPSLDTLTHEGKKTLLAEAKDSGFECVNAVEDMLWPILCHTHTIAHPLIENLLKGKESPLRSLGERERTCLWVNPNNGVVHEHRDNEWLREEMLLSLWRLLKEPFFPFRRCPWCKTGVFFLFKGRKYCSSTCRSQADEAKRKGTRGPSQRQNRAKRKELAEAQQRAQRRATESAANG